MQTECKTYPVMVGEPHLGRERECIHTWDRDDIVNSLITALEGDYYDDVSSEFELETGDRTDSVWVEMSEFISQDELDEFNREQEEQFLDDDYGTQRHQEFILNFVDSVVPEKAYHEEIEQSFI